MSRARALAVVVLLLSYGAVGARQPAVRAAMPLPVSAATVAQAAGLPSDDPSSLLLHVIRLMYDAPDARGGNGGKHREAIRRVLLTPNERTTDTVPLPLDPSIWRETILQQPVPDKQLIAAILNDSHASLLYHGLSALDDETLAWLGPDRETLLHLRKHATTFATFGRSIHVRAGRVLVPGGRDAEPLWESLTGVGPGRPAAFVQRLFRDDDGRLQFLYDAITHLDEARQRYALGLLLPESSRNDRLRALLDAFTDAVWRPSEHPFSRPMLDGSFLLSTIAVTDAGEPVGPLSRRIWERVFHDDELVDVPFSEAEGWDTSKEPDVTTVDAAWLAARISHVSYTLGRRRLDTVLFGQRVFADARVQDARATATALRGFASFPALMLTLERIGVTQPAAFANAALHAERLNAIREMAVRRASITQFQASLGLVERARRAAVISPVTAQALASSLCGIEVALDKGYDGRLAKWLRTDLLVALPRSTGDDANPAESAVLSAMAGVKGVDGAEAVIEWEGRRYRVDPAGAELRRLRRVRQYQGGPSLDAAMTPAEPTGRRSATAQEDAALADTLASLLYSAYLGDPDGPAVTSGNVAQRHDLGLGTVSSGSRTHAPWRLPAEDFGRSGWRVRGSLLGLETALGRLALRRLDPTSMPPEPKLSTTELHIVALTVALSNPFALSEHGRDEIAATLGRGRARVAALTADPAQLEKVAREAGLGEWRRQALAWTVEHNPDRVPSQFSVLELFWLGGPRPSTVQSLDAWGAATLPLTGCMCLQMPRPRAWEEMTGRPATGVLATRAADVALQVADTLASLQLPASLAPAILSFAIQDVSDRAQPAYFDDWAEFGRAVADLGRDRLTDYVAALTADGPLVPAEPRSHP